MLIFTDRVLADIDEHIGRHPAERGGALLAMLGSNVIAGFEPDPGANVTGSSYIPSAELTQRVQWREINEGLSFCGVVHSHPGGFDQPSSQDDVAFRKGLDLNPHLAGFVAPIVTHDVNRASARDDECTIGSPARARMRVYMAYRCDRTEQTEKPGLWGSLRLRTTVDADVSAGSRTQARGDTPQIKNADFMPARHTYDPRDLADEDASVLRSTGGLVRLKRVPVSIMPLDAELQRVIDGLRALRLHPAHTRGTVTELRGQPFLNEVIGVRDGELQLLFPPSFPTTRPILLLTDTGDGGTRMNEQEDWNWSLNDVERPGFLWRRLEVLFDAARSQ